MNRIKKVFIGAAASAAAWVGSLPSTAAIYGIGNFTEGYNTLQAWISAILNLLISVAGVIFMILLVIGGFQYLTGAGNEEQTGKAKKMMIDAVIGLIITLIAWAAGYWIITKLTGTPPAQI